MRVFFLIVFTCIVYLPVEARQNAQLMFDQANTLLEDGDYFGALDAYRSIEKTGEVSGALYLNMGIAATQIDSLGLAKFYFLRAEQFSTSQEAAKDALFYVESRFSRQSAVLPKLPWDKAVDALKSGSGATRVFIVGFILIFISVCLILLNWFGQLTLKRQRSIIFTTTVTSILTLLLAFYVDYVTHRYHSGVITDKQVQITQQPNETADLVSLAYEGYTITVDKFESEKTEGWFYIRLGNGQYGWIKIGSAKIL